MDHIEAILFSHTSPALSHSQIIIQYQMRYLKSKGGNCFYYTSFCFSCCRNFLYNFSNVWSSTSTRNLHSKRRLNIWNNYWWNEILRISVAQISCLFMIYAKSFKTLNTPFVCKKAALFPTRHSGAVILKKKIQRKICYKKTFWGKSIFFFELNLFGVLEGNFLTRIKSDLWSIFCFINRFTAFNFND